MDYINICHETFKYYLYSKWPMGIETIVGSIAAVCTTVAFLPQAIKTIRFRHIKDLSLGMYILISIGLSMWMVYGVLLHDWPLIISNSIALILTLAILIIIIQELRK
jgi:MtN3 and saliva related transmembrane protein